MYHNKESNNMIQCSSCSNSELDYKFDCEYSIRYDNLQNSRSLKLVDTNSVLHTPDTWLLDNSKLSNIEHNRICSESIDKPSGTGLQILLSTIYDQYSLIFSNPKDNVTKKVRLQHVPIQKPASDRIVIFVISIYLKLLEFHFHMEMLDIRHIHNSFGAVR
ncbi:unnamed protein product [Schistosoma turkestanicum]|nr:unnamed protein product [Schistosoma turkestanicum]